jgi:hypothetical protein
LLREPPTEVEDARAHETDVLDIAQASGRGEAINRDDVCGMLTKCLRDVGAIVLVVPCLSVCCWVFNFPLLFFCNRLSN